MKRTEVKAFTLSREMARFQEAVRFASVPGPWLYEIPADLDALAERLALSVEELEGLIANGEIPTRRKRDTLGRRRGPVLILIHDALRAIGRVPGEIPNE